ncbi:MAG: hypothetical protein ACO2PM_18150 [Pyrobaculum sp.]
MRAWLRIWRKPEGRVFETSAVASLDRVYAGPLDDSAGRTRLIRRLTASWSKPALLESSS